MGKKYQVYFDIYLNFVELQRDLLNEKIYACGMTRADRWSKNEEEKDDEKNRIQLEIEWRWRSGKMEKTYSFFFNYFNSSKEKDTPNRKQEDGANEQINMGFVDKSDELKYCYKLDRKSKQWGHIIFPFCWLNISKIHYNF